MGCWEETCCVSGLSIKYSDPVRFGMVSRTDKIDTAYAGDLYKFWTPLFKGIYDDYGSAEEIEPKAVWQWWFKKLNDPSRCDRHKIKWEGKEIFLKGYLVHEWAFDEVRSYRNAEELYSEEYSSENRVRTWLNKFKPINYENLSEKLEWAINGMKSSIDGYNGGFVYDGLKDFLGEAPPEDSEGLLVETADFVYSLMLLRKGIQPNMFFARQNETNEQLTQFTKLVYEKAVEQDKRYDEYDDEDEDENDN